MKKGFSDIHTFVKTGNEAEVKKWCATPGVCVDEPDQYSQTPLHIAAQENQITITKLLLKKGAHVSIPDTRGWTALHFAASARNFEICEILIKAGADVTQQTLNGSTVLTYISRVNNNETDKLINPHIDIEKLIRVLKFILEKGSSVNERNRFNETPLHIAALRGHPSISKVLIEHGADINAMNQMNETPLHYACRAGRPEIVDIFVKFDDLRTDILTSDGKTALDMAEESNSTKIISLLQEFLNQPKRKNPWKQLKVAGKWPAPRYYFGTVVYSFRFYVFAGANAPLEPTSIYSDMYVLNATTSEWRLCQPTGQSCPAACYGLSVARIGPKAYYFGGYDGGKCHNSIYELDLEGLIWNHMMVKGATQIQARYWHTATAVDDRHFIVMGGKNDHGEALNDVQTFDIESKTWAKFPAANSTDVPPRYLHTAVIDGANFIVFGGYDGTTVFNDLWILDLENCIWTKGKSENAPFPRHSHSASVVGNYMYIYGGLDSDDQIMKDVHALDLKNFTWIHYNQRVFPDSLKRCGHTANELAGRIYTYGGTTAFTIDQLDIDMLKDIVVEIPSLPPRPRAKPVPKIEKNENGSPVNSTVNKKTDSFPSALSSVLVDDVESLINLVREEFSEVSNPSARIELILSTCEVIRNQLNQKDASIKPAVPPKPTQTNLKEVPRKPSKPASLNQILKKTPSPSSYEKLTESDPGPPSLPETSSDDPSKPPKPTIPKSMAIPLATHSWVNKQAPPVRPRTEKLLLSPRSREDPNVKRDEPAVVPSTSTPTSPPKAPPKPAKPIFDYGNAEGSGVPLSPRDSPTISPANSGSIPCVPHTPSPTQISSVSVNNLSASNSATNVLAVGTSATTGPSPSPSPSGDPHQGVRVVLTNSSELQRNLKGLGKKSTNVLEGINSPSASPLVTPAKTTESIVSPVVSKDRRGSCAPRLQQANQSSALQTGSTANAPPQRPVRRDREEKDSPETGSNQNLYVASKSARNEKEKESNLESEGSGESRPLSPTKLANLPSKLGLRSGPENKASASTSHMLTLRPSKSKGLLEKQSETKQELFPDPGIASSRGIGSAVALKERPMSVRVNVKSLDNPLKYYMQLEKPNISSDRGGSVILVAGNKDLTLREANVMELIGTEELYVDDLAIIIGIFLKPLEMELKEIISEAKRKKIFRNVEKLFKVNSELLQKFKAVEKLPGPEQNIGAIFMNMMPGLKEYSEWCVNQNVATETVKKLVEENDQFKEFLEYGLTLPPCKRIQDFESIMIKPFQRITRYPLLLNELIKHTPQKFPDYVKLQAALFHIDSIVRDANETKRTTDNLRKMIEIQESFMWEKGETEFSFGGNPNRFYVSEMECKELDVKNKIQKRKIFIFSDILVISKPKGHKYVLLNSIPLEVLMVWDVPDDSLGKGIKNASKFVRMDSRDHIVILSPGPAEKEALVNLVNECIANVVNFRESL